MSTRDDFFSGLDRTRASEAVQLSNGATYIIKEPTMAVMDRVEQKGRGEREKKLLKIIYCTFGCDEDEQATDQVFTEHDLDDFKSAGGELKGALNQLSMGIEMLEIGVSLEDWEQAQNELDPDDFEDLDSYWEAVSKRTHEIGSEEAEGNSETAPSDASSGE